MRIAIGCDHAAYEMKQQVMKHLEEKGIEYKDFGTYSPNASDYPLVAKDTAQAVASGEFDKGIVMCGTGVGISIAKATRQHNDANMMAMGARVIGIGLALEIVDAFLGTEFSGEQRHQRRIDMITKMENE